MCALGLIIFPLSAWVFLSVIWGINNWPFLGKHFETIPWKVLVVPVVINITVSPLQASPGLERKKWDDLAWRYCNPMSQSAFFYIWPWWPGATRWSSAFWQLAQGHPVQSKSGPCGHNTWRALWMIQLGWIQVLSVPNGKLSLCPSQGSTAWGGSTHRSSLFL